MHVVLLENDLQELTEVLGPFADAKAAREYIFEHDFSIDHVRVMELTRPPCPCYELLKPVA